MQFQKHLDVYHEKINEEVKYDDRKNHFLGLYLRFAFNDPNNYPKHPFLSKQFQEQDEMSDDEMEKNAMRNTVMMGGEILL